MRKDFRLPWATPISKDRWKSFLMHDFNNPNRLSAFRIIEDFLKDSNIEFPLDFAEIGFGQAYDFVNFAKSLHDERKIKYIGYEITRQFVEYAREEYLGYDFIEGDFSALGRNSFDITYTRHVFEHLDPLMYEICLEDLLLATRKLCIIIWFTLPREIEKFIWEENTGISNSGAYCNVYSENKLLKIVEDAGFTRTVEEDVYILERIEKILR